MMFGINFPVDSTANGIPEDEYLSIEEALETDNVTTTEMENSHMKALYELTRLDCCGFGVDNETPPENYMD